MGDRAPSGFTSSRADLECSTAFNEYAMLLTLRPLLLLLPLALIGCDTTAPAVSPPGASFEVETDRSAYAPSDTVTVSFTSWRDVSVYVLSDGCLAADGDPLPFIEFERREGGEWVRFSPGYGCGAVVQPPKEVEPSGVSRSRFQVGVVPSLAPGTYRYVFEVQGELYNTDTRLPRAERTSNAFEVIE